LKLSAYAVAEVRCEDVRLHVRRCSSGLVHFRTTWEYERVRVRVRVRVTVVRKWTTPV